MVMAHARHNAELEAALAEMQRAEQEYVHRIDQLQRAAASQEGPQSDCVRELEELVVGYANRNAELEAIVTEMQQKEQEQVLQITKLQQAAPVAEHSSGSPTLIELQAMVALSEENNAELEATVEEMRKGEQKLLARIEQLQKASDVVELEQMAMQYAQRITELQTEVSELRQREQLDPGAQEPVRGQVAELECRLSQQAAANAELEAVIRDSKREEEDYLSQIVQLRQAADREAKRSQELEQLLVQLQEQQQQEQQEQARFQEQVSHAQEQARLITALRQSEQELRGQVAQLQARSEEAARDASSARESEAAAAAAAAREANSARDSEAASAAAQAHMIRNMDASLDVMKQKEQDYALQVGQLRATVKHAEEDAATRGRRNEELEAELSGMRHVQREQSVRIEQLEKMAGATDPMHAARIAELEAAVATHLKRNGELEAVVQSMRDRAGRILKLEQALQAHTAPSKEVESGSTGLAESLGKSCIAMDKGTPRDERLTPATPLYSAAGRMVRAHSRGGSIVVSTARQGSVAIPASHCPSFTSSTSRTEVLGLSAAVQAAPMSAWGAGSQAEALSLAQLRAASPIRTGAVSPCASPVQTQPGASFRSKSPIQAAPQGHLAAFGQRTGSPLRLRSRAGAAPLLRLRRHDGAPGRAKPLSAELE